MPESLLCFSYSQLPSELVVVTTSGVVVPTVDWGTLPKFASIAGALSLNTVFQVIIYAKLQSIRLYFVPRGRFRDLIAIYYEIKDTVSK